MHKERTISLRLFRITQGWSENEFFDSLDTAVEGQMHENKLTNPDKEPESEYEEPLRNKHAESNYSKITDRKKDR